MRQFAAGQVKTVTSTPFSPTEALRTIECNGGVQPAAWKMRDGRIWFSTIRGLIVVDTEHLIRTLPPTPVLVEDVVVNGVGRELYEKFFRNYTRKQWGLDPSELDAQVTARVPLRFNRDDRYFTDTFQAMPARGFTHMFENMLDHPNIKSMLNTDYREARDLAKRAGR